MGSLVNEVQAKTASERVGRRQDGGQGGQVSIGELDQVLRGEVRGVTDIKRGELHERADPRRKGGQITSAELSQEGKLLAEKGTRIRTSREVRLVREPTAEGRELNGANLS